MTFKSFFLDFASQQKGHQGGFHLCEAGRRSETSRCLFVMMLLDEPVHVGLIKQMRRKVSAAGSLPVFICGQRVQNSFQLLCAVR